MSRRAQQSQQRRLRLLLPVSGAHGRGGVVGQLLLLGVRRERCSSGLTKMTQKVRG
jgi:hypothetical protein